MKEEVQTTFDLVSYNCSTIESAIVASSIVALISIILSEFFRWILNVYLNKNNKIKSSLITELKLNIQQLEKYKTYINEFKKLVSEGRREEFFHYFDLSRRLIIIIQNLAQRGEIYDFFDEESLIFLQNYAFETDKSWEEIINQEINRELSSLTAQDFHKKADFWFNKFSKQIAEIQKIILKLK